MADTQSERLPALRGLQIDENIRVERRAWAAERFGWVGIAAIIVLALLGLFGPGPLSHESVESPDALLRVNYNRFVRMGGSTSIEVEISGQAAQQSELQLRLGEKLINNMKIQQIIPEPAQARAQGRDVIYTVQLSGEAERMAITRLS